MLGRILLGLMVGGLAAGAVLAVGVMVTDVDPMERLRFFTGAFLATGYGPAVALLGALVGVAIATAFRISSVVFYAVCGALIGLAASYSVDLSEALEQTTDIAPVSYPLALGTLAGLVGGLAYCGIVCRFLAERKD